MRAQPLECSLLHALDARRPIEGDIDRFAVQRLHDGWNVIEYLSAAMRVPAIPLPGRIVRNFFAVRILDYLQARPPDFYGLMGHLESLLGGVPEATDSLEHVGIAPPPGRQPVIEVSIDTMNLWLDGRPFPVKEPQAWFVKVVLSAIARFILGQLVLHVLREDHAMKTWYGRIKHRRGAKIGRVAVMRGWPTSSSRCSNTTSPT